MSRDKHVKSPAQCLCYVQEVRAIDAHNGLVPSLLPEAQTHAAKPGPGIETNLTCLSGHDVAWNLPTFGTRHDLQPALKCVCQPIKSFTMHLDFHIPKRQVDSRPYPSIAKIGFFLYVFLVFDCIFLVLCCFWQFGSARHHLWPFGSLQTTPGLPDDHIWPNHGSKTIFRALGF